MSKAEKFIIDSTKNYSNEKRITVGKISHWEKQPWLTPDEARKAVEIAREEAIEKVKELLLSEVLPCFMHGGEADEVVAMLDDKIMKDGIPKQER